MNALYLAVLLAAAPARAQEPKAKVAAGIPAGFSELRRYFDGLNTPLTAEALAGDWKHVLQAGLTETVYRPRGLTTRPAWIFLNAPLKPVTVPSAVHRQYAPADGDTDWGPKLFAAKIDGRTLELFLSETARRSSTNTVIKRRWTMPCRLADETHLLCRLTRVDDWDEGGRSVTIISESFAAFSRAPAD